MAFAMTSIQSLLLGKMDSKGFTAYSSLYNIVVNQLFSCYKAQIRLLAFFVHKNLTACRQRCRRLVLTFGTSHASCKRSRIVAGSVMSRVQNGSKFTAERSTGRAVCPQGLYSKSLINNLNDLLL